jgi:excinuclease ABC subunit B
MRPARNQVEDLLEEIRLRVELGDRVLVTTLTKRMAEELTGYYRDVGIRVRYLHSEIPTIERTEILRDLRLGAFDVLVGINLLREGLDLPEVSLVAILDADKEGFLRAERSLIQTCGRASRNLNGRVIMYADRITRAMKVCMDETTRRRGIQAAHNKKHKITPRGVQRAILDMRGANYDADVSGSVSAVADKVDRLKITGVDDIRAHLDKLRKQMHKYADDMQFEKAAEVRDRIKELTALELELR